MDCSSAGSQSRKHLPSPSVIKRRGRVGLGVSYGGNTTSTRSAKLLRYLLLLVCLVLGECCADYEGPVSATPTINGLTPVPVPCSWVIIVYYYRCSIERCMRLCHDKGYMDEGHHCYVNSSTDLDECCCVGEQQQLPPSHVYYDTVLTKHQMTNKLTYILMPLMWSMHRIFLLGTFEFHNPSHFFPILLYLELPFLYICLSFEHYFKLYYTKYPH